MSKTKGYLLEDAPEGLYWVSKDEIMELWDSGSLLPIEEVKLLPLWVTDVFSPPFCVQALILGLLKAYDIDNGTIEKVKKDKGIDVGHQKPFYKELLLSLFDEPQERNVMLNVSNILSLVEEKKSFEYAEPFYRSMVEVFPTFKVKNV